MIVFSNTLFRNLFLQKHLRNKIPTSCQYQDNNQHYKVFDVFDLTLRKLFLERLTYCKAIGSFYIGFGGTYLCCGFLSLRCFLIAESFLRLLTLNSFACWFSRLFRLFFWQGFFFLFIKYPVTTLPYNSSRKFIQQLQSFLFISLHIIIFLLLLNFNFFRLF